jgi:PleD family two-component response regulator
MNGKIFTILLATENLSFQNNLSGALRMQGFKVEVATSGFHMLHMLENQDAALKVDLIILNENMRDMAAPELVSLIRVNQSKKELPIIFISKFLKDDDEVCDAVDAGINDYVEQSTIMGPIILAIKKNSSS